MSKTKQMVFIAIFAVLMSVCAWISVPTTVPFTMQTFAVFMAINYLGGKNGTIAVCVYLLLGMIGLPVFAGGTSGVSRLIGNTGGYMIGWILSGLVMWLLEKPLGGKLWGEALNMVIGLLVCYVLGTVWFMMLYAQTTGPIGLGTALGWCVLPFVIPDLAKLALALLISQRLKRMKLH